MAFFVADKTGSKVIIEFLEGKTKVYSGSEATYPVLCNSTYINELNNISTFDGYGGTEKIDLSSKEDKTRFVKAAYMLKKYDTSSSISPIDYGFDILKTISFEGNNKGDIITRWSIIYDIKNSRVLFRTASAKEIKHLDLKDIDFSCQTTSKVYNLDNKKAIGDISTLLVDFKKGKSQKCLKKMWKGALLKESFLNRVLVKSWATKGMINYSETVVCKNE